MPHSGPKLSDFYTLSQTKLLENHTLHSSTYIYSLYGSNPCPPPLVYLVLDVLALLDFWGAFFVLTRRTLTLIAYRKWRNRL